MAPALGSSSYLLEDMPVISQRGKVGSDWEKESRLYLHLACSGSCWQPRLAFHCRCWCTRFSHASFYPQEQYRLCYELALSYLNSFETYGNFK